MIQRTIPEILAPAGTMEALYAALHAGAEAVYFGGKVLSARAYAGNFEKEQIIEAAELAHRHGAKAYLTLNTLVKNPELRLLEEIGNTLCQAGIDAVILQDMGVYLFFRKYFPELTLHASTQMTVHSSMGAKRLHELGFRRVVLSRELTLAEVCQIMKEAPIEVETFVHGALCYCYSGQCQMSAAYGERSANRGKCAQPCRLSYQKGKSEGYHLSLKDQMTLYDLPRLVEAGIHSFKIEGRMKNPEYVYTVTQIYKKYRDLALSAEIYQVSPEDIRQMSEVFSRGATSSGYYFVRKTAEMVAPEQPKTAKLTNPKVLAELSFVRQKPELKTAIRLLLRARQGRPLELAATLENDLSVTVCCLGEIVQAAEKRATTVSEIEKPLRQLGETSFLLTDLQLEVDPNIFVPAARLKELRRQVIAEAERQERLRQKQRMENDAISRQVIFPSAYERKKMESPMVSVLVRTEQQLAKALASVADRLYLEWSFLKTEVIIKRLSLWRQCPSACPKQLFLAVPTILRNEEWERFWKEFCWLRQAGQELDLTIGILARTADYLSFFAKERIPLVLDHSMNIWNQLAYQFYEQEENPVDICLSNELSYQARSRIGSFETVVYGKLATMQTANCLANIGGKEQSKASNPLCRSGAVETLDYITDRKGARLGYHRNCKTCSNTLFNPIPLFLADQPFEYAACLRLELLDEAEDELNRLMAMIPQLKQGKLITEHGLKDFTRGHYHKGVE